jgi:hypothetical protein
MGEAAHEPPENEMGTIPMRKNLYGLMAAGIVFCLSTASADAREAGPKCESSKLGTSAKYAQCRLKADAKAAKTATIADYSKCSLEKFMKAEDSAGVGVCPTEGDQTTVSDYLEDCTSRAAMWLAGGGGLPDTCASDLSACEGDLATCEAQPQGKAPKTGQTTCYDAGGSVIACAGTGQDGESQNGLARSFTDNGDGTITDNNSGLMWEKLSDDDSIHDKDTTYTWANAFASKVATLNGASFAGYSDWRMPSTAELETLKNFGAVSPAVYPAFNTGCMATCTVTTCSCTQSAYYWSSTTYQNGPSYAWSVSFADGFTFATGKTSTYYARAVRAGS